MHKVFFTPFYSYLYQNYAHNYDIVLQIVE